MTKLGLQALSGLGDYETDMPAFRESLSDEEIWAVLACIESTWPAEAPTRQAVIRQRKQENRGLYSDTRNDTTGRFRYRPGLRHAG